MSGQKKRFSLLSIGSVLVLMISLSLSCASSDTSQLQFEISFPTAVDSGELTGRVYVMITSNDRREPRLQAGGWSNSVPFFGMDVEKMRSGDNAVIDESVLGYPLKSLREIPAGNYYVQALFNIYTEFRRSDGHVIWAHMDQWEGQQFNRSPGNLYSDVQKVHLDPGRGYSIKLSLDKVIPPVEVPEDTEWVKYIKFQSPLLSEFWGQPIYLGASVLLPKGYASHPDVEYPVHYIQGHFSLRPPYGFREDSGFFDTWTAEDFPRMIAVTFQHPCPFFDDSYAVNSANCGPYGDALLTELIPLLEEKFRIIRKPYARVLSGGSTGGWEALALQIFHPDFFGGTWSFFPDPVDFRYYQLVNIYEDENAFFIEQGWMKPERPMMRDGHGQVMVTFRQMSQLEAVLGSRGRSGQQMDAWNAVYGPVGKDGYPQLLWDKETGVIDHKVAEYIKDYDLRLYLEENWKTIGSHLAGKLHVYCGDMDNFYLNEAVYEMESFLEGTQNPYYAGTFQYGRPRQTHGWNPFGRNTGEMEKEMADEITKKAPPGENSTSWKYR